MKITKTMKSTDGVVWHVETIKTHGPDPKRIIIKTKGNAQISITDGDVDIHTSHIGRLSESKTINPLKMARLKVFVKCLKLFAKDLK